MAPNGFRVTTRGIPELPFSMALVRVMGLSPEDCFLGMGRAGRRNGDLEEQVPNSGTVSFDIEPRKCRLIHSVGITTNDQLDVCPAVCLVQAAG